MNPDGPSAAGSAAPAAATSSPSTIPTAESLPARIVRMLLGLGLALVLTLLLGIAILGWSPTARAALTSLIETSKHDVATFWLAVFLALVILLMPVGLLWILLRQCRRVWPVLGAGWALSIPVLVWLAWDDSAVRRPLTMEELSPAFAGAEKSYAVLMQYSKQQPSAEAKVFAENEKKMLTIGMPSPAEADKWVEWVTKNRVQLMADWELLAPQRKWWAELMRFERLGDLTPPDYNANIVSFGVWRKMSQRSCAVAALQALEGRGDEAMATLLSVIKLGRNLQRDGRTLVRVMIGVVLEKMGEQTAAFVLDRAKVSAASRASLAAVLTGGNPAATARHMVLIEVPAMTQLLISNRLGQMWREMGSSEMPGARAVLDGLGFFVLNPRATANIFGDHIYALAKLAEARELGKLEVWGMSFEAEVVRHHGMKNLAGYMLVGWALPSFNKVLKSHWETADLRAALLKRVTAPGG